MGAQSYAVMLRNPTIISGVYSQIMVARTAVCICSPVSPIISRGTFSKVKVDRIAAWVWVEGLWTFRLCRNSFCPLKILMLGFGSLCCLSLQLHHSTLWGGGPLDGIKWEGGKPKQHPGDRPQTDRPQTSVCHFPSWGSTDKRIKLGSHLVSPCELQTRYRVFEVPFTESHCYTKHMLAPSCSSIPS